MNIGDNIRKYRKENKKMSAKELANKVGLKSAQAILQYERGDRTPNIETLNKIATALNVEVQDLLTAKEAEHLYLESVSSGINDFNTKYPCIISILKKLGYYVVYGVRNNEEWKTNIRHISVVHEGKTIFIPETDIIKLENDILKYGKFILDDIFKEGE